MRKGSEYYQKYKDKGVVIYYPYFIAEKSRTLVNSYPIDGSYLVVL